MSSAKSSFKKPTVKEVYDLMNKAAQRYQLEDWESVHRLIGVSDRTFRRWKKNVDKEPNSLSAISFQGYANLYAVAEQKTFITPFDDVDADRIPESLIMGFQEFEERGISTEELLTVMGLKGAAGKGVNVFAANVGLAKNTLHRQIHNVNDEKVSYGTWALILQLVGVPVERIF